MSPQYTYIHAVVLLATGTAHATGARVDGRELGAGHIQMSLRPPPQWARPGMQDREKFR